MISVSVLVLIEISRRLMTENLLTSMISIFGGIMFGLDTLGDWEDLVFEKSENLATYKRRNWSDKLCLLFVRDNSAKFNDASMKLDEIRHVGVSIDLGLFVLTKNGKTTSLSTNGMTRNEIQTMRREINHFLNLTRIRYIDKLSTTVDLRDRLIVPSDSDDDLKQK